MNVPNLDIRGEVPVNGRRVANYEQMMKRFNQLNSEYNKMANQGYAQKEKDNELTDDVDREKDYEMVNLLKKINGSITEKIRNVKTCREDLEKYETYKTDIEKLAKAIDDVNELYEETVIKSNAFFSFDVPKVEKKTFEKDQVEEVVNAVNDVITDRISKIALLNQNIVEYKKLINECIPKEDVETVQAISNELLCAVCLTNKINVCITPCGHTFCDKCTDHMKSSCYMCKGNVSNKVKLFLGTNGGSDDNGVDVQPRPANFDGYAPIGAFNFNEGGFNAIMGEGGNEVPQFRAAPRPEQFVYNGGGIIGGLDYMMNPNQLDYMMNPNQPAQIRPAQPRNAQPPQIRADPPNPNVILQPFQPVNLEEEMINAGEFQQIEIQPDIIPVEQADQVVQPEQAEPVEQNIRELVANFGERIINAGLEDLANAVLNGFIGQNEAEELAGAMVAEDNGAEVVN